MNTVGSSRQVLVLCCPTEDLIAAAEVLRSHGTALLPAGGPGDLDAAAGLASLYIVEVTAEGARSAATWHAALDASITLTDPGPEALLPPSWVARHPQAYRAARRGTPQPVASPDEPWDDDDLTPVQVFIPITDLTELPIQKWVFANELVPKQQRLGRRFAPRVPTLVRLPD